MNRKKEIFLIGIVFTILMVSLFINKFYLSNTGFERVFIITIYLLSIWILKKFKIVSFVDFKNSKFKIDWYFFSFSLVIAILLYCLNYIFIYIHSLIIYGIDNIILRGYESVSANHIIFSIIIYPLIEELLFRDCILKILSKKNSKLKSLLISSFLFSIVHLFSMTGLYLSFFSGIIFGLVYLKTNSVLYSFIVHSLYNGIVLFFNDKLNLFILNLNLNQQVIGLTLLLVLSSGLMVYSIKKMTSYENRNQINPQPTQPN